MLVSPFDRLRFRIWQLAGFDPQIPFGRLTTFGRWDLVLTIAVAAALGWYWNHEPATVTALFLPIALLGIAVTAIAFAVSTRG